VELTADETHTTFSLRAGVDTADFAVDRPESIAERAHTAPLDRACFSFRVRDDSSAFYTARAYRSVFTSPVPARTASVKVTSSLERGAIALVLATSKERKLPRELSRRRWVADR
jgi:hypothetical protein